MAARPYSKLEERIGNRVVQWMSRLNVWAYRWSGGRLGGKFLQGAPVLLLISKGRKSGEPRTAPLLYLQEGERYYLVASKGGMSHHPAWYLNLEAEPDCEIEIGRQRLSMRARRLSAEEKAAVWPRLVAIYRYYDAYQQRTARDIPVLELRPRPAAGAGTNG